MEARLSSKGQVVIPKELRDKLGLSPRNPLKIYEQDGKIIIESIVDAKDEDPWEGMEILDLKGRDGDEIIQEAMGDLVKAVSETDKE